MRRLSWAAWITVALLCGSINLQAQRLKSGRRASVLCTPSQSWLAIRIPVTWE